MAGEEQERNEPEPDRNVGSQPGRPERPRLRRRPFGYRRADVDEALDERDGELAELRQDIAALWLAFAQHDRMLRALTGDAPPPSPPTPKRPAAGTDGPTEAETGRALLGTEAASIGTQLSELDEVLAAIETATKTLEKAYADEIRPDEPQPAPEAPEPADADAGPEDD